MARRIPQRLSAVGLAIVAASLVMWPALVHDVAPGHAATVPEARVQEATGQEGGSADFDPFWVEVLRPALAAAGLVAGDPVVSPVWSFARP